MRNRLFLCSTSAVDTFHERKRKENPITIAPNPTSDIVTISGLGGKTWTLLLYDDKGNTVITTNISGDSHKIDVKALASGTYFVILKNGDSVQYEKNSS